MLNDLQVKYLKAKDGRNSVEGGSKLSRDRDSVPLGDCIETEIDSVGLLQCFKLRPAMIDLVHWKDDFDLTNVLRIIRTVNQMNRLLLQSQIKKPEYIVSKSHDFNIESSI